MSRVTYDQNNFYIDGKPTKIVSGAIHYFRVMPEYWYDRLLKLKECGCNCVETYICWNLHEKREGEFDFSGGLDFVKFLKTAKELGLYAMVRPGPFICSEWDFGGLPWWLLKYPDIKLRCSNETFMNKCAPYLKRVSELLKPQLITNGGNVIFVQIENEYGSYGTDKEYLGAIKKIYEDNGIDCGFLTSDGDIEFMLEGGTLPDVLATVNYRLDSKGASERLHAFRKNQPSAVLELWNGKQFHWQEPVVRRDIPEVAESVRSALKYSELVNLYMFHGGTSFGFMNGSIMPGKKFILQMTSYDVDAPLDEYGRRTEKYYAEQKIICDVMGIKPQNTATDTEIFEYKAEYVGECSFAESKISAKKNCSPNPLPMEYYDQGYGYIVYEADMFVGNMGSEVFLPEIHDAAHIYLDGKYVTSFFRHDEDKVFSVAERGWHKLQIFVENLGRINYGMLLKDNKGLVGDIMVKDNEIKHVKYLHGFKAYSIPLDSLPTKFDGKAVVNEPAFYRYDFEADTVQDTVVHFEGFFRGVAFINGFNLGRHWTTDVNDNKLFIPAPLIKKGKNEIVVFDALATENDKKISFHE